MRVQTTNETLFKIGYYFSLFGTIVVLLWIGIFKFTPTEAKLIRPLVEHHPLMSWSYHIFDIQIVSNFIGAIEIIISILLVLSLFSEKAKNFAIIGLIITFITTLSFLFTTPKIWKVVDNIPITDFFILKDIMFLGFGIMLMGISIRK